MKQPNNLILPLLIIFFLKPCVPISAFDNSALEYFPISALYVLGMGKAEMGIFNHFFPFRLSHT